MKKMENLKNCPVKSVERDGKGDVAEVGPRFK